MQTEYSSRFILFQVLTLFFLTAVQSGCSEMDEPPEELPVVREDPRKEAIFVLDEWMRDPYITLAPDGYYYLTCTRLWHTEYKPGLEAWRSKDLMNWEALGLIWNFDESNWMPEVLPDMEEELDKPRNLWAPEMRLIEGQWVAVFTTSLRYSNLIISQNDNLQGPFKEPFGAAFHYKHDPSVFIDDSGAKWLVWSCTKIARLKDDWSGFAGPVLEIGPANRSLGHEGCFILKIENKYVLFGTAWSTDTMRHGSYNLYYCTSDRIQGPYGPRKFADRFLGHGTIFKDKLDRWWCTAFLNGEYVSREHVRQYGISTEKAETMNPQGLTLVPMEIKMESGDVVVRAKDPMYATPGDDETQKFVSNN